MSGKEESREGSKREFSRMASNLVLLVKEFSRRLYPGDALKTKT